MSFVGIFKGFVALKVCLAGPSSLYSYVPTSSLSAPPVIPDSDQTSTSRGADDLDMEGWAGRCSMVKSVGMTSVGRATVIFPRSPANDQQSPTRSPSSAGPWKTTVGGCPRLPTGRKLDNQVVLNVGDVSCMYTRLPRDREAKSIWGCRGVAVGEVSRLRLSLFMLTI